MGELDWTKDGKKFRYDKIIQSREGDFIQNPAVIKVSNYNSQEDYYQEVCLQIWRSRNNFSGNSKWSTWIYRLTLNICMTLKSKETKRSQVLSHEQTLPEIASPELFSFNQVFRSSFP